ncbi:hypothetical protein FLONG3_3061 [Fusarium longipes]|uniref:Heterokaryon incompatibility domain-containing protein n=1 Tax=Fusarium longipes TaxID=694270 RepID=A0A395T3F5_9HYPO|nr:hypothetical protein FLONG3_3061 [Fusarium longipes]
MYPASDNPYPDSPLPSQGWFRLLTINPSREKDRTLAISCTLQQYQIVDCPPYEGMSYTWGDDEATKTILVNGCAFAIRPNLFSALESLRNNDDSRTVWIDAICINQQDEQERNNQVLQMNNIYSCAALVNVWLGDATTASDAGVDFLQQLSSCLYNGGQTLLPTIPSSIGLLGSNTSQQETSPATFYPGTPKAYLDLYGPVLSLLDDPRMVYKLNESVALLARPWWRRMWTLQESVLCRKVICWCGSRTFPMEYIHSLAYFVYFSLAFNTWRGRPVPDEVSLVGLWRSVDLREHIVSRRRIRLTLAFHSTWDRVASDAKDKIFGLLGLVGRRYDLQPEYSWPVEKVYRVAMRAALMEDQLLDCLGLITEAKALRNKKLNSWVPDFSVHDTPFSDDFASISRPLFRRNVFDASLEGGRFQPKIGTERDDTVLKVNGLHFDKVQKVGPRSPGSNLPDDTEASLLEWEKSMRAVLRKWRSMLPQLGVYHHTGESFSTAFWRTVLVDIKQGEYHKSPSAMWDKRLDKDDIRSIPHLDTPEGTEKMLKTWSACMRREYRKLRIIKQVHRRLVTTDTGYIGLGPPDVEVGDSICVLMGGSVPYVLRQNTDDTWCYIGECYVHGIMDGKVVDEAFSRPSLQMADPLTIIGTAGAIANIIDVLTKTITVVFDMRQAWKIADLTVLSFENQLNLLLFALCEIQKWAAFKSDGQSPQLGMQVDKCVAYCRLLIAKIDQEVSQFEKTISGELEFSSKLTLLFKTKEMEQINRMVDQQTQALTLLLSACNINVSEEQNKILDQPKCVRVFQAMNQDTASLFVHRDNDSIMTATSVSSSKWSLQFSFDKEILVTNVYERWIRKFAKPRATNKKLHNVTVPDDSTPTRPCLPTPSDKSERNEELGIGNADDIELQSLEVDPVMNNPKHQVQKPQGTIRNWKKHLINGEIRVVITAYNGKTELGNTLTKFQLAAQTPWPSNTHVIAIFSNLSLFREKLTKIPFDHYFPCFLVEGNPTNVYDGILSNVRKLKWNSNDILCYSTEGVYSENNLKTIRSKILKILPGA